MATYTSNLDEVSKSATDAAKGVRGQSIASGALTGLSTGLSAGSLLGPVGAGVGAVLGAGVGLIAGDIAGQQQQKDMVANARGAAAESAKSQMLADIDAAGTSRSMGVSPSQKTSLSIAQRSTSAAPSSAQKYMTPSPTPFDSWNAGTYGG